MKDWPPMTDPRPVAQVFPSRQILAGSPVREVSSEVLKLLCVGSWVCVEARTSTLWCYSIHTRSLDPRTKQPGSRDIMGGKGKGGGSSGGRRGGGGGGSRRSGGVFTRRMQELGEEGEILIKIVAVLSVQK
jgi:hypothetical protein